MGVKRRVIFRVLVLLVIGAVINIALALMVRVQWPGLLKMEREGVPLSDAQVQRVWQDHSESLRMLGIGEPPAPTQGAPLWMFRGWTLAMPSSTFVVVGNGYVP